MEEAIPKAVPADGISPEEERLLEAFLIDFLCPIAADGRLEGVEETPLLVAFHAYGVDRIFQRPSVKLRLLAAIQRARQKETAAAPLSAAAAWRIWHRLRLRPDAFSLAELDQLLAWLDREAPVSRIFALERNNEVWKSICDDVKAFNRRLTMQKQHQFWDNVSASCRSLTENDFKYICRHYFQEVRLFRQEPLDRRCLEDFISLIEEARRLQEEACLAAQQAAAVDWLKQLAPPVFTPSPAPSPSLLPPPLPPSAAPAPPAAPPPPPPPACRVIEGNCATADLERWAERKRVLSALRGKAGELLAFLKDQLAQTPLLPCGARLDRPATLVAREEALPENLWFIGDVHGDILGLEAVLSWIEARGREDRSPPVYVFLGDLVDRLPYSYEVILRFLELWRSAPGRVLLLAGNHSEALRWSSQSGWFSALVSPCELADWLNRRAAGDQAEAAESVALGRAFIEFVARTPRALFLPDGLLAAHGGVPHRDLHAELRTAEDLNRPACLQDFVWSRLHPRAPRRIPNRASRTCDLGREDFEKFCEAAERALGRPVRRMVRGHDHVEERYEVYAQYRLNPVLTINTMCCRQEGEFGGAYARRPACARWRRGELPEVCRLELPEALVRAYYPEGQVEEAPEV